MTHNIIGFKRGIWVIKISEEKKIVETLHSIYDKHEKSNAHRLLMKAFFNKDIYKDKNFDNYTELPFEKYVCKKVNK